MDIKYNRRMEILIMGKSKVEHDFRITPFHVNNAVTGSSLLVEVD